MKSYEAVAKTADEAIEEILEKMGVGIDELDIEIEEAKQGLFGFLKQKQVRVIGRLKNSSSCQVEGDTDSCSCDCSGTDCEDSRKVKSSSECDCGKTHETTSQNASNTELINDPQEVIKEFIGLVANGIQKNIEVNVKEDKNIIKIDISGEDVSLLIGKYGRTLDSMRSLLSLMINRGRAKEDLKRVLLDVEGYRRKRDNTLEKIARNTATKVIKTKKEVSMESMNPYERRIVHSVLQRNKLVSTRSEGEEPNRHVVVFFK